MKNNQDYQIQSAVYNRVWGKAPEAGEFSRIFVLKVTLQSVRLLLTVSYRKNWGAGCTRCSANNFVGELYHNVEISYCMLMWQ